MGKYGQMFRVKLLATGMLKFVRMVDVNADLADYLGATLGYPRLR